MTDEYVSLIGGPELLPHAHGTTAEKFGAQICPFSHLIQRGQPLQLHQQQRTPVAKKMGGIIEDLTQSVLQAVTVDGDEVDRLQAALAAQLAFHAGRAQEVFIGNAELRCLSDDARDIVVQKRHECELSCRA